MKKMQLYILTSRTLILRLHFYLENVSLMAQIPLCTEGSLLIFRSKTSHSWTCFQCLQGQLLQGLPESICPSRIVQSLNHSESKSIRLGPSYWKFRSHCFYLQVRQKMYECFFQICMNVSFPSTAVGLYLFFLVFYFLRQSLRKILPRLIREIIALMITKHCYLEDCLSSE